MRRLAFGGDRFDQHLAAYKDRATEVKQCRLRLVDHARDLPRNALDNWPTLPLDWLLPPPFFVGSRDFLLEAIGILGTDTSWMTREFRDNAVDSPTPSGKVPDYCLKAFATLAFASAVADQVGVVVVATLIMVTVVMVCVSVIKARQQGVEEIIDRRQRLAVAELQSANGDVAFGVAVQFNGGLGACVFDPKLALNSFFFRRADQAQSAPRNGHFAIGTVRFTPQFACPPSILVCRVASSRWQQ